MSSAGALSSLKNDLYCLELYGYKRVKFRKAYFLENRRLFSLSFPRQGRKNWEMLNGGILGKCSGAQPTQEAECQNMLTCDASI